MAANALGLGKGLDALIRETSTAKKTEEQGMVALNEIVPNPEQPRKFFSDKALEELAASIKAQGLLQPILVKPAKGMPSAKYVIIAGERRWRASQLAGLLDVPVVIKNFSEQETLVAALVENLQREDLNPIEEALGIQSLKSEFGLSQEVLAHSLGKSRSAIANSLRLLTLPEDVQSDVSARKISAGHARALLSIDNAEAQQDLKNNIIKNGLSVREVEALATLWKEHGSFDIQLEVPGTSIADSVDSTDTPLSPVGEDIPCTAKQMAKKPQCVKLLEAQASIANVLKTSVRVTGSDQKGKISITFSSSDELESLLSRIITLDSAQ